MKHYRNSVKRNPKPSKPFWHRIAAAFAFAAVCMLLASCFETTPSSPNSASPNPPTNLSAHEQQLYTELQQAREHNQEIERQLAEMKTENSTLKSKLQTTQFWLVAVGAAIGVVVAGLIWFVAFSQRKHSSPGLGPEQTKCPRCGWKIDRSDEVCGNPDCRTRFK